MSQLLPGSRVGDYEVEGLQRTAGAATVYRASQTGVGRDVALLVPDAPPGSELGRRFLAEVERLAEFEHPNALPVYDVGVDGGVLFASERAVAGRWLDELIAQQPLTPERATRVIEQLADAVEAAERADVRLVLTPSAIVISSDNGRDHAHLSTIHAALDESRPKSGTEQLARLLAAMLTGRRGAEVVLGELPPRLRPVVERGLRPSGFSSPMDLARAASETVAHRNQRRPRWALVAIPAVLVATAAAIATVATPDEPQQRPASSPANAPAGRIVATIPVEGTPRSVDFGDGAVWVALTGGTLLKIDPKTNRVAGAPIRFTESNELSDMAVRVGAGAVFALDPEGGTVTRIDPRRGRVTGRVRFRDFVHAATVSDGVLWVTYSRNDFRSGENHLVRLDPRTLRRIGKRYPVGSIPEDIEVADGTAWVMAPGDGSITRVRPETDEVEQSFPTGQPAGSTLRDGMLWVPNPLDRLVVRVDTESLRPNPEVTRVGVSYGAIATRDAVWIVAVDPDDPGERANLHRIDVRTARPAGRPVDLGPGVGWPVAGAGAVWVFSAEKRAILRIAPTAPPPQPAAPAPRSNRLRGAPLTPGRWEGDQFVAPFTIEVREPGWVNGGWQPHDHWIGRVDSQDVIELIAPRQLIQPGGGLQRVASTSQVSRWLERHPQLDVSPARTTIVGGVSATTLDVRVDARRVDEYPPFCSSPCVLSFADEGVTWSFDVGTRARVHLLKRDGRTIVITEMSSSAASRARNAALVETLRFK